MDKQKAWRLGCICNIENTDLEIGVSFTIILLKLAHLDVVAQLAHFTDYTLTFYNRMIHYLEVVVHLYMLEHCND